MYVKTIILFFGFIAIFGLFGSQKVEAISLETLPPLPHELPFNQSGHTYTEYVIWHAENDNVYLMYHTPDSGSITMHHTFGINFYVMPGVGGFNINYILSGTSWSPISGISTTSGAWIKENSCINGPTMYENVISTTTLVYTATRDLGTRYCNAGTVTIGTTILFANSETPFEFYGAYSLTIKFPGTTSEYRINSDEPLFLDTSNLIEDRDFNGILFDVYPLVGDKIVYVGASILPSHVWFEYVSVLPASDPCDAIVSSTYQIKDQDGNVVCSQTIDTIVDALFPDFECDSWDDIFEPLCNSIESVLNGVISLVIPRGEQVRDLTSTWRTRVQERVNIDVSNLQIFSSISQTEPDDVKINLFGKDMTIFSIDSIRSNISVIRGITGFALVFGIIGLIYMFWKTFIDPSRLPEQLPLFP